MKKPEPLKARGIRFEEGIWERLKKLAKKCKDERIKASDLVRHAVDEYLERNE